ncbi:Mannan endo-1,4-beta-mannosidase [Dyadobacter sp. CECT 9623]|uniref:Mannan endo-1,4-beta-mannosidase n=1 Tax=Dyadobacter linearis TaxID=2823330 RepID=A0ABN7RM90_9BACT|nr:glycosyl hydrolase [Dyadobacter sp. CECT 9623]CAG5074624.1 Mannan endo-1,4-beta-mannosidase [Dyadobacter sp. CECT 9623]
MIKTSIIFLATFFASCSFAWAQKLIDSKATPETAALYQNMHKLAQKQILFGHQDATDYGHGWRDEEGRSDVKLVTGSHPAVIGVDIASLTGRPAAVIERNKQRLKKLVTDTYIRGGVTTISWHFSNPVSGGGFNWKDSVSLPAVKYIIPTGQNHQDYKAILKDLSGWFKSLKGPKGEAIPLIFRPYHEFDGDWFWWGRAHCTPDEFKSLWKFTAGYLRDSLDVHNLIYAFSPDNKFNDVEKYTERYPGNEWVDLVGMDNYGDVGRDGKYNLEQAIKKIKIVNDFALQNGKLAAMTETGLESVVNPVWYTDVLLKVLQTNQLNLAYVLLWRNDSKSATHYYAPYPGHPAEPDFKKFYNDDYTLFENDLKNIYGK